MMGSAKAKHTTAGLSTAVLRTYVADSLGLFASMRFAIALLTVLCIASVVGTVLKQHEPSVNYINQFGPFWAAVFAKLQLYSVYSAWWFLLILAFLVLSTSLCIARNAPRILADLKNFKENIRVQAFRAFPQRAEGELPCTVEHAVQDISAELRTRGWKFKIQARRAEIVQEGQQQGVLLAAKKGTLNKFGYLATHSAIVLVCIGGLMDGDLMVRALAWVQGKTLYEGGGLIADVPKNHWLSPSTPAFRGNLFVSEGAQAGVAILNQSDGVFLQPLPFSIELKNFFVEFYSTGMPKLFASDIVVHDAETGQKTPARVEVNHPFHYKGVAIYQSSFDDGGSKLVLEAIPIHTASKGFEVQGTVGSSIPLSNGRDKYRLELTGLRVFNIEDIGSQEVPAMPETEGSESSRKAILGVGQRLKAQLGAADAREREKRLRNIGPSVRYKLRNAAGQAIEYNNYMQPVDMQDGSLPVFLLGVRESATEEFRYLRIPVDDRSEMEGFFRLRKALYDPTLVKAAAKLYAQATAQDQKQEASLEKTALQTLAIFAGGGQSADTKPTQAIGLQAISDVLEHNVPAAERENAGAVVLRVLNGALFELNNLARVQRSLSVLAPDEQSYRFIAQTILGFSDLAFYPTPLAFRLKSFEQVQASVFQVTKAPGQAIVYLGSGLLIFGVFAMLYIRERRLWVWLSPTKSGTSSVRMAMSSNRQTMDTEKEFAALRAVVLQTSTAPSRLH